MKNLINYLVPVFFLLIIGGTLLNFSVFYYPSQIAYFSYALLSSVFLIGLLFAKIIKPTSFRISLPFLTLCLWLLYIAVQVKITQGFNFSFYYPLINLSLLFAVYLLAQQKKFNYPLIFKGILLLAVLQALICLLQYLSIINSYSTYFKVTGSWQNPNVTAMFLTMTMPVAYYLWLTTEKKKILVLAVALIVIALLLLVCRSAFLGIGIFIILILFRNYNLLFYIKNEAYRTYKIIGLMLLISISIPFAKQFYQSKKASADGRLIIWKVSATMIANHPLIGGGYGLFEQQYNLQQAKFIAQNKLKVQEKAIAGAAKMAYNDYLQNAVEGGIIGLILFSAVILTLLLVKVPSEDKPNNQPLFLHENKSNYLFVCKMGIAAFAVMGMVNFVIEAIPVMCLFVFYATILSANISATINLSKFANNFHQRLSYGSLLILSGLLFVKVLLFSHANFKNKQAKDFLNNQQPKQALIILKSLENQLSNLESYHSNYTAVSFALKDYPNAIEHLKIAKRISSSPHLYSLSATIYQKMGQHQLALQELQMQCLLTPALLTPKYNLMKCALQLNNQQIAIASAQEILQLKPKIPSKKATYIKLEAQKLLRKLGVKSNPYTTIKIKSIGMAPTFPINQPKF